MCHAYNKKWEKQLTEGLERPNQERIRIVGEKDIYKYLGILEADIIKQVEMKEKNEKRVFQMTKKTSWNQPSDG